METTNTTPAREPSHDEVTRAFAGAYARCEDMPELRHSFDVLDVTTFRDALADPLEHVSTEDAEMYAQVAAVIECDDDFAPDATPALEWFIRLLNPCVLAPDDDMADPLVFHDDGRVTVEMPGFGPKEITKRLVQHAQWILALFVLDDGATRFLDALPAAFAERAREHARSSEARRRMVATFHDIVHGEGFLHREAPPQ